MTKAKTKNFDCVQAKRRAQRGLTKALSGHSPAEQVEILRRLAEKSPFWKNLRGAKAKSQLKSPGTAQELSGKLPTSNVLSQAYRVRHSRRPSLQSRALSNWISLRVVSLTTMNRESRRS
ncbi:MAG: hypothetical protein IPK00_05285 [Deltaproteobacteria bacterium]|nr:hypothetical protein [Deltaproteobacteria bacterium]